jgi:hypothetical protein
MVVRVRPGVGLWADKLHRRYWEARLLVTLKAFVAAARPLRIANSTGSVSLKTSSSVESWKKTAMRYYTSVHNVVDARNQVPPSRVLVVAF